MKHLFFLLPILLFTLSFNAQSINKISTKCRAPYTGIVGSVAVTSIGDIVLSPCPTRTNIFNSSSFIFNGFTENSVPFFSANSVLSEDNLRFAFNDTLQSLFLMDSAYTGGSTPGWSQATRQSYLTIGNSSSLVNNVKSVYGIAIDVNRGQTSGGGFQTSGIRVRANASKATGNGITTAVEAFSNNIDDSTNTSILQAIEGITQISQNADIGYGGYFHSGGTSGGSGTTINNLYGVWSDVNSFNQFTVTDATVFNGIADMTNGATTNLYGLRFTNWGGSAVTNSYVIYADNSVDIGTGLKYFILSGSMSPSSLAGDIYISSNTKGIVLKSPDGSCYRYTAANGGALNAGVLITCP